MNDVYYAVQLDYDKPVNEFENLKLLFNYLKDKGHISIYTSSDKEYMKKAVEEDIDTYQYPLYIEPHVRYGEGMFIESIDFWIENHMINAFYNPDFRPHIETYFR